MTTEVCPYCRGFVADDEPLAVCEGCGTRHHADCYAENGGCTIFGCSFAPAEEPKLSVSVPELANAAPPAVSLSSTATAAPPLPSISAPPSTVAELRQISNRIVPSMFGAFEDDDGTPEPEPASPGQPKSRTTYMILGALLGAFGAHNFYAGYTKKAIAQLAITLLTLGFGTPMSWIWAVIDICTVGRDSMGVQFES